MNNKAQSDDWRIKLAMPIFKLIDLILKTPSVAVPAFERFRQRESIRGVLQNVYVNKAAVDDELVDIICSPCAPPLSTEPCRDCTVGTAHCFERLG